MKKTDLWLGVYLAVIFAALIAEIFLIREIADNQNDSISTTNCIFEKIEAEPKAIVETQTIERIHDVQFMTQDDRDLMMRVATAEGANQGEDGMWLIMSVIMNRVSSPDYPDNVHDVIYQPYQFTSILDTRAETAEPTEACEMAMVRIEEGEIAPEIIAFDLKDAGILEEYFEPAFDYRDHRFFTKKGE